MLQQFDEHNRNIIVNVAGRLTHRDEATVSPFGSAVQGGGAAWGACGYSRTAGRCFLR